MKTSFALALLALVALLVWCSVPREATRGAIDHASLNQIRIYAYRDWQSTSVRVHKEDLLTIEAEGEWTYTPGEVHGPEGHRIYRAPSFYPLPGVAGGVLIGRIGEEGKVFHVGRFMRQRAQAGAPGDQRSRARVDLCHQHVPLCPADPPRGPLLSPLSKGASQVGLGAPPIAVLGV
jgi:hypothetical protein